MTMKDALANAGLTKDYVLTKHAIKRIRQRAGIDSIEVATAWASEQVAKATQQLVKGKLTHHISGRFEIIADGLRVVTVKPAGIPPSFVNRLNSVLTKEVERMVSRKERELRKIEISIAEHTLNQLKAKNPNTKALIMGRLTDEIDERQRMMDDLYAIRKAASQFGVDEI